MPGGHNLSDEFGHWEVNARTGDLCWSDSVYRIHGLEVGTPIDVETAINVYHPDDRDLPIRLTPMTATCRVPPLSRVKLGIGWSRGVARDAEQ